MVLVAKTVAEMAKQWEISERSVRNYCEQGRVSGAVRNGKKWEIPEDAVKPERTNRRKEMPEQLVERLRVEKEAGLPGGLYQYIQVKLSFNSNCIEGSRLTEEQTRLIFETNTVSIRNESLPVDDIVEAMNHFRCFDLVLDHCGRPLSEGFIKDLHRTLKDGTSDSRQSWFAVGEYKKLPNYVGDRETTRPEDVGKEMRRLLREYNAKETPNFDDLLDFHVRFERIHPFQDGNGRVGRLILFHECLRCGIVPFMIDNLHKNFYYRGLSEWHRTPGYLRDTCLLMQDDFKAVLKYFEL